jgi:hypothetical protein
MKKSGRGPSAAKSRIWKNREKNKLLGYTSHMYAAGEVMVSRRGESRANLGDLKNQFSADMTSVDRLKLNPGKENDTPNAPRIDSFLRLHKCPLGTT